MFDISHETFFNTIPSSVKFEKMKNHYLGEDYELSIVFCKAKTMRQLNGEHRSKDYATNILSFPYSESSGEIFICPAVCKKQYKDFDRTYENFLAFLYAHGLVHLKGYDHGDTMDKQEEGLRNAFSI